MRQVMLWFATADDARFRRDRFPIYLLDTPGGFFYGLPVIDPLGHKACRHYGAEEQAGPAAIDHLDRSPTDADAAPVRDFLRRYLPDAAGELRLAQVCVYTLTPDRHFLIDRHPDHPQVTLATGFSGHGFKFASVVGEILADLVERGRTDWPVELFRIGRLSDQQA